MSSRANNSSSKHRQLIDGNVVEPQESGALDVVKAIGAMNRSYQPWLRETSAVRSQYFLRSIESFRLKVQNSADELTTLLALDIGTAKEVAQAESLPTALALLDRLLADKREYLERPFLPVGHSALFLGWSDPLVQFCRRVPAIMSAGGGLVVKPSRRASKIVLRMGELWTQALSESQVPAGLFAVLTGGHEDEESVGALLLEHPGFKTVFWIGETDTGLAAERVVARSGLGPKPRHYFYSL